MTNGWMVLTKDNQVVHAREVLVPDPLQDQARLQLIEETSGPPHMLEVDPKKTPMRLVGKQPMPGRMRIPPLSEMPRLNLGGESSSVVRHVVQHKVQKSDDQVPPQSTKERTGPN